ISALAVEGHDRPANDLGTGRRTPVVSCLFQLNRENAIAVLPLFYVARQRRGRIGFIQVNVAAQPDLSQRAVVAGPVQADPDHAIMVMAAVRIVALRWGWILLLHRAPGLLRFV